MNRYKILLTVATMAIILSSCGDDFLGRAPQGEFSTSTVQSVAGVEGLLVGAYAMVDGTGLDGQPDWNNEVNNLVFGGVTSDNALKGSDAGDQPEQSFLERYEFNTDNGHITNKWRGLYKGVARCNDVITTTRRVTGLEEERRKEIIAEARFLRGFFHFEAQKMWRFPVYADDATYDINDVNSTIAPNGGMIWDKIEEDFRAAAADLPKDAEEVGRADKDAANAFLAKALVYQGWNDDGSANMEKLSEAKPILEAIVNSGDYELVDFSDNFLVETRNNSESIWEVQYAVSSSADQTANRGTVLAHPYISPWGCCGFYQASQNLVNAFRTSDDGLPLVDNFDDEDVTWETEYEEPLDPRIDHTLGRPGILFKDFQIHQTDFIRDLSYAGPYSSMKHVAESNGFGIGGWGNLSANNYRIMRYGMVILWLAEVEVEMGNLDRARELVNIIRTRAAREDDFVPKAIQDPDNRQQYTIVEDEYAANYAISTYDDEWTDQDEARKAVRFESRLETAMEGHRFFDLQRWGVQKEVLSAYLESEAEHRAYLQGVTFESPKNQYYPIPILAIDLSVLNGEVTITQDPNY